MIERHSDAQWQGTLREGQGRLKLGSGAYEGPYTFRSRFGDGAETNPEELIAAAHAGCYTMALVATLSAAGHAPTHAHTRATVRLEQQGSAFTITQIDLETEATVPGLDDAAFQKFAEEVKSTCPVSRALAATPMTLKAKWVSA
jgi:osmotically inducible protein OsmC